MTDIEKVRLLIGTVVSATYSDAQIQGFLDIADDYIYLAAAMALEARAAELLELAVSENIGDYSYSKKSADNLLALAARYRASKEDAPAMDWAEFDFSDEAFGETD